MIRRLPAFALAAGLGVAVLSWGAPLLAQPSPDARAAAAALFEDGRRLMSENKYAEACPKLEESQRIDPGMGTLYNLSVCFEAIGRTASAWVGFREVSQLAAAAGQADREKAARGKASALEPKLIRLKITVQAANAGIEVKRDGAVISPALWGTPVPLDPGKHRVSASGPGKEPWEVTIQLDHPGGTVNVDVPPLLERKAGSPPPPPPGDTGLPGPPGPGDTGAPPLPLPPGMPNPRPWQTPLGIVATVLGAGGLAGGVAFGVLAKSSFDASNSGTPPNCDKATNKCNPDGINQRNDAVSKGNVGTGLFIGGAVLAAGGIVLWITAPSSHPTKAGAATPQLGLGPNGVSLRGAW